MSYYSPLRTLWSDLAPAPWWLRLIGYPVGLIGRSALNAAVLLDDIYAWTLRD